MDIKEFRDKFFILGYGTGYNGDIKNPLVITYDRKVMRLREAIKREHELKVKGLQLPYRKRRNWFFETIRYFKESFERFC